MCDARQPANGADSRRYFTVLIEGDDKHRVRARLLAYGRHDIEHQVQDRWPGYTVLRWEEAA